MPSITCNNKVLGYKIQHYDYSTDYAMPSITCNNKVLGLDLIYLQTDTSYIYQVRGQQALLVLIVMRKSTSSKNICYAEIKEIIL
jgi:hypothetical protein